MGGRGSYSIRKAFGNTIFASGTKTAKAKAETTKKPRGNFGGGSDSGRQTDASMLAEFSSWRNGLNEAQIDAIAAYTNGAYGSMNRYLRGQDPNASDFTKQQVKNLNSSFNHALSKGITVYRGTGMTDSATLAKMTTVGGVFRDKGAFSTSISRSFARSWAASKTNPVIYTVRLPKGFKNGAYVRSISPHKSEKEYLIKPGQNWKVVRQLAPVNGVSHFLITPV